LTVFVLDSHKELMPCSARRAMLLLEHCQACDYLLRSKSVKGFQIGDLVKAVTPQWKKQGSYRGRIAIRASGLVFKALLGYVT